MCGKTSIKLLGAIYARCRVVVGSDTGPIHLAAAVGTFVVGLYGFADWRHTYPWAEPGRVKIMQSTLECSPCQITGRKNLCLRAACMESIFPETVFDEINYFISHH
ncbi:MAG: hypothetical protein KBA46_01320 [Candidatus Omnitrophica bacterium]|nr:hypothetical protein [Candidatus Omnitrophota bacterium]